MECILYECNIIGKMLQQLGLSVTYAEDGGVAITQCEHAQFDVIFLDCHMPRIDGFEAASIIRDIPSYQNIPIVAVTAATADDDREKCKVSGMNYFLAKPITMTSVKDILSSSLPHLH